MSNAAGGPDRRRWGILALLFTVRTVMATQYQAIGALSPILEESFAIGLAEVGVLIGLYVAPGIVFALPGASIGNRFGERPVVATALALMAVGATLMATAEAWELFVAGHFIAGVGGVIVNIIMTKMVTDWFAGAEITTALAIFINSWPFGIAVALVVFPPLVAALGLTSAFWLLAVLSLAVGVLVVVLYRAPNGVAGKGAPRSWPRGPALQATLLAGLCWGAFNGGLGILFGLGTSLLVTLGAEASSAARTTSVILWTLSVAAPFGGVIADRTGRGIEMIVIGTVLLAILSPLVLVGGLTVIGFVVYGAVSGLVAGPIMSLPARVLSPQERISGMGLFFTVYYVIFVAAPALAGALADLTGSINAAFWSAACFQIAALLGVIFYRRTASVRE